MAIGLALFAALAIVAADYVADRSRKGMTIRFMDVGQGDCTLILWPGGAAVVDAGPYSPTFDAGRSMVAPALWRNGFHGMDALFVTHGDNDHIGGAVGLLDRAPARMVDGPDKVSVQPALASLRGWAIAGGKYGGMKAGDTLNFPGGPRVTALNPAPGRARGKETSNSAAMALKVGLGNVNVILASDIEKATERRLAASGMDLRGQVLKVAHHGSNSSTSVDWIDAINPKYAVISVGLDNRHKHPGRETLNRLEKRGIKIYRTDLDGEVILWTDGEKIEFETYGSRLRDE